jgi:hypothetical protein
VLGASTEVKSKLVAASRGRDDRLSTRGRCRLGGGWARPAGGRPGAAAAFDPRVCFERLARLVHPSAPTEEQCERPLDKLPRERLPTLEPRFETSHQVTLSRRPRPKQRQTQRDRSAPCATTPGPRSSAPAQAPGDSQQDLRCRAPGKRQLRGLPPGDWPLGRRGGSRAAHCGDGQRGRPPLRLRQTSRNARRPNERSASRRDNSARFANPGRGAERALGPNRPSSGYRHSGASIRSSHREWIAAPRNYGTPCSRRARRETGRLDGRVETTELSPEHTDARPQAAFEAVGPPLVAEAPGTSGLPVKRPRRFALQRHPSANRREDLALRVGASALRDSRGTRHGPSGDAVVAVIAQLVKAAVKGASTRGDSLAVTARPTS